MSNFNDDEFKEVRGTKEDFELEDRTEDPVDDSGDDKDNDYEDVCYICRRPESAVGKMIHIPGNVSICVNCLQKTFDTMGAFPMTPGFMGDPGQLFGGVTFSGGKPIEEDTENGKDKNVNNIDLGNIPGVTMMNLQDLSSMFAGGPQIPNSQRLKKKKPGKKAGKNKLSDGPIIDIKNIPPPHKIKGLLDRYVVGQEKAKKTMAVGVYNHYKRVISEENLLDQEDEVEIEKSNMLMIGPTGSGKTYLVKTLARLLDVPLAITDATSLTEAGYIGDDIESVVSKLLAAADNDVERAQKGIIFIDEIDKLAKKRNANTRDVSGESVQQGMLKLLEGATVEVPVGASSKNAMVPMALVDTSNILFICGGAFPDLADIIKERLNKSSSMGFVADLKDKYDKDENILDKVTAEDLRKFGMIPEFIGRLPIIFSLQSLSEEMLVKILTEPKNAILKQYQKLLAIDEVDLQFEDEALHLIAQKAKKKELGARALRSIIEEFMMDIMYEIPKDDNIGTVTITRSYIEGKGAPVITMRSNEKPAALTDKENTKKSEVED
ncbi:MAG: ATP-dependent Clp protease ATP-binding subunit ClpX [Lachnospiraceae bacterium]|nr:ATP-dependent Clp protease ATP-binding subunit ClpX [Lachnospiraceae bacterium]